MAIKCSICGRRPEDSGMVLQLSWKFEESGKETGWECNECISKIKTETEEV